MQALSFPHKKKTHSIFNKPYALTQTFFMDGHVPEVDIWGVGGGGFPWKFFYSKATFAPKAVPGTNSIPLKKGYIPPFFCVHQS